MSKAGSSQFCGTWAFPHVHKKLICANIHLAELHLNEGELQSQSDPVVFVRWRVLTGGSSEPNTVISTDCNMPPHTAVPPDSSERARTRTSEWWWWHSAEGTGYWGLTQEWLTGEQVEGHADGGAAGEPLTQLPEPDEQTKIDDCFVCSGRDGCDSSTHTHARTHTHTRTHSGSVYKNPTRLFRADRDAVSARPGRGAGRRWITRVAWIHDLRNSRRSERTEGTRLLLMGDECDRETESWADRATRQPPADNFGEWPCAGLQPQISRF